MSGRQEFWLALNQAAHDRGALRGYLRGRFPGASVQDVDDAIGDAFVDLVGRPLEWRSQAAFGALLRMVAWRALRARTRRSAHRLEVPSETVPEQAALGCLVSALGAEREVGRLIEQAAAQHGASRPDSLRRALHHRIYEGCTDTEAAERAGIRREYVNRAVATIRQALRAA